MFCSSKVIVLRKPIETVLKSSTSTGSPPPVCWKRNDGPTTRPLMSIGSGAGCPKSCATNVSENSPSASERKRTSMLTISFGSRWPSLGEKENLDAKSELFLTSV